MKNDISQRLVDAIADGSPVEWLAEERTSPWAAALEQLGQIAGAFRSSKESAPERASLFKWCHLEVTEKIGEGGFGEVFRAYDPVLRRDVALKLNRRAVSSGVDRDMVIAEARRMARVRHPNILAVHGADEDDDRLGIWCDMLEGQTLDELLREVQHLPAAAVFELALPLAEAVALIHRRGMSHGDIKPANIMVLADGSPVLMDFGAAREPLSVQPDTVGSPVVMAPEQFNGMAAGPATDVYAFGAVLFKFLTGNFPIQAESVEALADKHAAGMVAEFARLPRGWRPLLRAMLSRQPDLRPTSNETKDRLLRMKTARRRLLGRLSVAVVISSLSIGTIAATLAYRSAARSRDRIEQVKNVVVKAMETGLPTRQSGPTSVQAIYGKLGELIEERLVDYPDALAEMRVAVGHGLGQLGDVEGGLAMAERGMALMRQTRPGEHWDLAHGLLHLATLRTQSGDIAGAEEAVREALERLERTEGKDTAQTRLIARNRLALVLDQQGRWLEAAEAHRQLLNDRRALHGENSVRLAVDYHNLARTLVVVGDVEGALANEERAAELLRLAGDEKSVRMGFIVNGVAIAQIEGERFEEAQYNLDEARALFVAGLPQGHPKFDAMDALEGRLWARSGRLEEAVTRFQEIGEREGLSSDLTLEINRDLAAALLELKRWQEAHDALRAAEKTLTPFYTPIEPHLKAALAYSAYRAGLSTTSPHEIIHHARETMQAAGYDRIREYRDLERWLAEPSEQPEVLPYSKPLAKINGGGGPSERQ